ncbi:tetratricopeptide repeat protein [Paraburkholderia sp. SOS3]|uniref:tetratricopeptide repeat protein n=1 Tax=Paraburkholderia sp. SOS3 TaxID=1926494 RepID=UPI0018DC95FD|nr:tetratricopeptide repeat protein [Paraburkholderia sp. SOS3]
MADDHADIQYERNEVVPLLGHDPRDPSLSRQERGRLYLRLGILDLRSQRYADAIDDFDQVLSRTQSLPALIDRAIAYTALGKLDLAIASYSSAIALDPQAVIPLINRADIYAKRKQFELAVADYSSALALQPDNASAYFERATARLELSLYALAADDYVEAARQRPTDAPLRFLAGISYLRAGLLDDAIASFTAAIQLDPAYASNYTQRGTAYMRAGRDGDALADFSTAIRLDAKEVDARLLRAEEFEKFNQLGLAIADYTATLALTSHPERVYIYRADDLTEIGQDVAAQRDYDRASRIAPDDLHLRIGRMRFWFYQGEYWKAIQDANRWLELAHLNNSGGDEQEPYVLAWRHMSTARLRLNDNLAAAANYLDKRAWPYPVIAYYLGEIDAQQLLIEANVGDQEGLAGRQCEAYSYLGESYMARRQNGDAKRAFEGAISICPTTSVERILAKRELANFAKSKNINR